jgi:hypothetical protein
MLYGFDPRLPGDEAWPLIWDHNDPHDLQEMNAPLFEELQDHRNAAWSRLDAQPT